MITPLYTMNPTKCTLFNILQVAAQNIPQYVFAKAASAHNVYAQRFAEAATARKVHLS
jgi:hypothetical protein